MNSVFYKPHMLQYSSRIKPVKRVSFGSAACLRRNMEEKKYIDKINETLKQRVVPEFGQFEPVSVIFDEDGDDRFTVTVKSVVGDDKGKDVLFAYVSAKTGRLAFATKKTEDNNELSKYLKTLSDNDIDHIKRELKKKAEE